jgi:hypothetical protein
LTKFLAFLHHFLHLPTLVTLALAGVIVIWMLYEMNFDWGDGFIRLNTNRGSINLYWFDGCCDLSW